jgi:hypothetical protein
VVGKVQGLRLPRYEQDLHFDCLEHRHSNKESAELQPMFTTNPPCHQPFPLESANSLILCLANYSRELADYIIYVVSVTSPISEFIVDPSS